MQLLPLFLLPFYNPILLAEQLATLDVISGGRTTVINALGYDDAAFTAFQITQRARVSRFTETFEIMRMLWERDGVRMHLCWGNYEGPITGTSPWRKSSARCSKPGLRPSSSR
jgi:alkanesulfonate monooxygenase SsuD/methylene tetrahydromethanopterin reductase-like flavin-dependent oxidoreductase (luciferase family)